MHGKFENGHGEEFYWTCESESSGREAIRAFKVWDNPSYEGDFFEVTLELLDNCTAQTTEIYGNRLRGKGIPEVFLPIIAGILDRNLRSSSSAKKADRWRTEDATRMWERLRKQGLAGYDEATDQYFLPLISDCESSEKLGAA